MAKHDPNARRSGPPEPLLTLDEVATALQVSTKTVRRLIDRGELQALHIGRQVRLHPASLQTYLREQLFQG